MRGRGGRGWRACVVCVGGVHAWCAWVARRELPHVGGVREAPHFKCAGIFASFEIEAVSSRLALRNPHFSFMWFPS